MTHGSLVRAVLAALLVGGAASPLVAQATPDTAAVDRIVAVVGNTAILRSQVDEKNFQRLSNGARVDTADAAAVKRFREESRDSLVNEELLYLEALADTTIHVLDQEVNDAVDQTMRKVRSRFPSEQEFLSQLRLSGFQTPDEWRRSLTEAQHRELVLTRYRSKLNEDGKLKPLIPTEKEMRAWYDAVAAANQLGSLPATISIKQIVVRPQPNAAALAHTRALADSIVLALRKGADFATTAKRFSMDPISRDQGGDLGWVKRGQMVRPFEEAAFALPKGVISNPVESVYGWHVVQVTRINLPEVRVSHILLMPEIDSGGAAAAKKRIDEIAAALATGASFDSLQRLAHDPAEEREVELPVASLDSLPGNYTKALAGLDSGKVSAPFILPDSAFPNRSKWAIVRVIGRTVPGPQTYESMRDYIRRGLGFQLGERAYIASIRAKTYVEIRDP